MAAQPVFQKDGTVEVPAFSLPPSGFLSPEALAQQQMRALFPILETLDVEPDIAVRREQLNAMMAPRVAEMYARFAVTMVEEVIGGIRTQVFTPADGDFDAERVLINLHGGAFNVGWDCCSQIESLPIAALGRFKVISVDYRMAPEYAHPAGVEDVAMVYRELLKTYRPGQIGIYGGSAGGALTAHAAAWFPLHDLPQCGAVGIFGAGAVPFEKGESAYLAAYIDGTFPAPATADGKAVDLTRGYFKHVGDNDPVVHAALHPDVIGKFPPSLVITGTRAMDLSPAIVTNSKLLAAGVRSTLVVGEGMGHCYYYSPALPESHEAFALIIKHFRENLG